MPDAACPGRLTGTMELEVDVPEHSDNAESSHFSQSSPGGSLCAGDAVDSAKVAEVLKKTFGEVRYNETKHLFQVGAVTRPTRVSVVGYERQD